ncbi:MAG: glycosyltransferase family 2 protein [Clostridium sp.]|nr:glycosyltransferase family 2 protein [Clostridium sp.]MCM1173343.1 glycosyltransferase family 2 protein [Clostridium sp.]MCM1209059.1 glycosyltransferase family 2 protein [Ruminococcus sp.]
MLKHTFVVCAYKESRYLESCVRSLVNQTVKSNIIMTTSTKNEHIRKIAEKYKLPLYINGAGKGIAGDWNFAYAKAETEYVTIAHQDDVYAPNYVETMINMLDKAEHPSIGFTGYFEIRKGKRVTKNTNLIIKRLMLLPLNIKGGGKSRSLRRMSIAFGNPICCPSVTYVKRNLPSAPFDAELRSNLDWQLWERLSKKKKSEFVYCAKPLMGHRIHEESETSAVINDNKRSDEDYKIFRMFWPAPIAKAITKVYAKSEKSNKL